MQYAYDFGDTYAPGSVVTASLAPEAVADFDPLVRRLLVGTRQFTKRADGSWRPCGCELGFARCFDYEDLRDPKPQA